MSEERKHRYWSADHKPGAAARRRARRVRRGKEQNRLPENFGKVNWDHYTHREMWNMVKSADTGRMGKRAHDWQTLGTEVDRAAGDVQHLVQRLVMSWRGPSSVVAAESASRLAGWAADASRRAYRIGSGVESYTSTVAEAARRMPEPVHPDAERWFKQGYDVGTLDGPEGAYFLRQLLDDHMPSKEEQRAAKARAVEVMRSYEDASRDVHRALPTFDAAPEGAAVPPDQPPPRSPWPGPDSDGGRGPGGPRPVPPPEPSPEPRPETPSGGRPQDTTSVAAVAGPAAVGGPAGSGFGPGSGFGSGGFGPLGSGGTGGPGGTGGGFGPLGSGGAAGVLGATTPGGVVGRGGVVGAAGAPGAAGYGMYPPMAPANQDEDREHRNRYDDGLDLLDDLPPAFPPVLGE